MSWAIFLNDLGAQFCEAAVRVCLHGGAAILVVWLVCRFRPSLPGFAQCWLWRLAHLKLLAAALIAAPITLPVLPAPRVGNTQPLEIAGTLRPGEHLPPPTSSIVPGVQSANKSAAPASTLNWAGALFVAWLCGVGVVVGRITSEGRRAFRELRATEVVTDERALAELSDLSRRFQLRNAPPTRAAAELEGPILVGARRPAILVPLAIFNASTSAELRLILAHELAHLKRRDLVWGWLPVLCHVLFFFFPPVWFAYREYRLTQEVACDELTLQVLEASPADYGAMLLKVAHPAGHLPRLAAVGVAESYETLSRRLKAMKHSKPMSRRSLSRSAAALLGLAAVGLVPWRVVAQDSPPGTLLHTLKGHQAMVFAIAYSPDGMTIASGGQDKNVVLWDAQTGKMKAMLQGHTYGVEAMAFSPDGKTLASAGRVNIEEPGFVGSGGEVRFWDVDTGQLNRTVNGHRSSILSMSWAPDGRTLATSGGYDKSVRLWDVRTGAEKRVFDKLPGVVYCLRFSPDGRTLATGGDYDDRSVKLWDVTSGELKYTFPEHVYGGWQLAYSPDGKTIFSTGGSTRKGVTVTGNEFILWDGANGEVRRVIERNGAEWARSVAYSPNGDQIAIATGNDAEGKDKAGHVKVYDVRTGNVIHTLRGHADASYSIAYSPDGKRIASGSLDGTVKIWQVK